MTRMAPRADWLEDYRPGRHGPHENATASTPPPLCSEVAWTGYCELPANHDCGHLFPAPAASLTDRLAARVEHAARQVLGGLVRWAIRVLS